MYHNTGEAAFLIEPLDERISEYLKKIIRSGCRRPKELQSRADEFVREKIFSTENPPNILRRKFRPNRRKIRNIINSVKNEIRFSKVDQENVNHLKKDWESEGTVFFQPR